MEITVHIPDEVAEEAHEKGLTAESYVEKLVVDRASLHRNKARTAFRVSRLNEFFDEMAAHSAKISPLPDEAFTRESFYADHN
jgi:hypothetical protein